MKHSLLYFVQNSAFINFIIVWWKIISKMFTVVLSTKRISASFSKETYDFNKNELKVDYEDCKDLSELSNAVDSKSEEIIRDCNTKEDFKDPDVTQQEFVPKRDCKFLLHTRLNPDEPQVLPLDDVDALRNSYFNTKLPVRFLIHGWLDHADGMLGLSGRKAYLQKGRFNIISVDWSLGADTPNYFKARSAIFLVGPLLAKFIDFLVANTDITTSDIYLVGHSLGAHIAGIAGKNVTSGKINTIYGLDPAGPMFFTFISKERLDVHDAKYVEVIHTSYQGFGKPIGYSDFYVNGGKIQPGCNMLTSCSHMRSIAYWSESINTEIGFYATPLEDNQAFDDTYDEERKSVQMGGEPGNQGKARGSYKLETHSTNPFAMGFLEFSEEATECTAFT